ncbi:MAG: hypothetical protein LBR70_07430 [Lactobacillaceae bacterium]|jgi:hypothetical protein|nr:hypothetical protein [Lactobacillaceae bacterium]
MIKGLINGVISLFTSGLIFNPMVLIGIGFSILINTSFSYEEVFEVYKDYNIYFMAVLIAFTYIFFFKRPYKFGGEEIDYAELSFMVFGSALRLILSSVLMTSFIAVLFF